MKTQKALVIGLALTVAVAAHAEDFSELSKARTSHSRESLNKVPDLQKAKVNYLACLNSETPGVVESALGHVTLMRIVYPKQDLTRIQEKLYDLAARGATKSIRQKAFIAMQVFADPTTYRGAILDKQGSGDGLLDSLAYQL